MSWKKKLQLLDMKSDELIEARCSKCSYIWYERASYHLHKSYMRQLFLDEFEEKLKCKQWACRGKIKIALTNEDETEGFQGGLA